jgi:hypothetical protein
VVAAAGGAAVSDRFGSGGNNPRFPAINNRSSLSRRSTVAHFARLLRIPVLLWKRGKAVMSKKLELASAIDAERNYARAVVRAALGRLSSLSCAASSQGLVMLTGLASAVSGYVIVRIRSFSLRDQIPGGSE